MNHGPFILGAYLFAFLALGGLAVSSWIRMRRADREE